MNQKLIYITLILFFGSLQNAFSDEKEKEKVQAVKFGGSASLSNSFYNSNNIAPRQPGNMQEGINRQNG